ncbi:hyaluronan mediated motility receptor-like [Homarus americanus]|uniref:hyaluronan mediated motility receptor-like n=1 Tax=Homarus americanus TaxID=6706 RepID=UPI001C474FDA|nr:hyaluronan mediated motility receptor-like [Homarus americanus]XP_042222048.1 hyaluronan mediated motility receptor-like [Homarus americanus]
MFSKAKIKRFNEEVGCAPPPTAYNPKKTENKCIAVTLDKSERWRSTNETTPGPGTYRSESVSPVKKHTRSSSSRLDTSTISTCSNGSSTSSSKVFLSPPHPHTLTRSSSMRTIRGQTKGGDSKVAELEERIQELTEERNKMKLFISQLETQLESLKSKISRTESKDVAVCVDAEELQMDQSREQNQVELENARSTLKKNEEHLTSLSITSSALIQQTDHLCELIESRGNKLEEDLMLKEQLQSTRKDLEEAQQLVSSLTDERSGLQLKIQQLEESAERKSLSEDELQGLREHVDHLTLLRDNLEASIYIKDDLIAELQVQLDEVVVEGRGYHDQMESYKSKLEHIEDEIENSFKERNEAEYKVRGLIAKYEALMKDQVEERDMHIEILAKKDIEIELLNGSMNNLNMKIAEYEQTLSSLQEEVSQRSSKIFILESTVSDLSLINKEKEVMESMMEEDLNHRTEEVSKLEETIHGVERKLNEVKQEKDCLAATLEVEQKKTIELSERIHLLEVQIKEKEVVQQFLEKEITSREAEISESSTKVKKLESDLDTACQVALDLQEEAEAQLNHVLTLKATISAKDYDIDAKGELISTLQEEISQKLNETSILQDRCEAQSLSTNKMEEKLKEKKEQITNLNKEISSMKDALSSREKTLASLEMKTSNMEDNNHQLEEKVVELMAEISDREAQHISRLNRIERDLDDLGVKYSEALLEQEATRRALTQTTEQLEKENLLRMASDADIQSLKEEVSAYKEENKTMESNLKDLVQKYTNLEDALACEEAENRDLEDKLEREVRLAQEAAAATEKELSALQTSSSGFCTQITQLKIDMRKKSQAVEEMQQCIETLREEKMHLTTLRDNLEKTVETKEDTIAQLHLRASTEEREMEEERVTLRSRIADLENHLKEAENKISDLEDKMSFLEEEKLKLTKSYEKQLEEKTHLVTQATHKLEDMDRKYNGYEDQLKNLQTSLLEKTSEAEDLQEKYTAASKSLESQKEEVNSLETNMNRLKDEIDTLSMTLASKDNILESLNDTLDTKSDEMQSLYKNLKEKQAALVECETRLLELEVKEEKLIREKEEAADSITNLQETLNSTRNQLSRLELIYSEEKTAEVSRVTQSLEADKQDLKDTNAALLEEVTFWKDKFQHLEKMVEPFREQLDAYEVEKASLLERSSAAKEEVDKLSKQYATLLGHQNHKQKIQHVLKLKTENSILKEEVHKLRQEIERQRKNIRRLEDKMVKLSGSTSRLNDASKLLGDKENSFHVSTGAVLPMASTPLKTSNKPQRL